MPHSLARISLHLVFSTKGRHPWLDAEIRREIYPYMAVVLREECNSPAKIINGTDDHVHILFTLSRTETAAHVVEMVKKRSSRWIKSKGSKYGDFQWQAGYGIFSVSRSAVPAVERYIAGQSEHHAKVSFQEEYLDFLNRQEVEYDERYLWD